MAKRKSKLPTILYIVRREEDSPAYFLAEPSADGFEDGEIVGIYHLANTRKKRIQHSLTE